MFSESPSCLVAVPEGVEFDPIRKAVLQALDEFGIEPLFPTDLEAAGRYTFVIADITSSHPVIFYQLGYADARRNPTLIIGKTLDQIPPQLDQRVIVYRDGDAPKLLEYLRFWIKNTLEMQQARVKGGYRPLVTI